jgi:serine/threonine protein kinase
VPRLPYLELVSEPRDGAVHNLRVGERCWLESERTTLGRRADCDIRCYAEGQGGLLNSIYIRDGDRVTLRHARHGLPIFVRRPGVEWESVRDRALFDGDEIQIAPGLVFRFHWADTGALRDVVARGPYLCFAARRTTVPQVLRATHRDDRERLLDLFEAPMESDDAEQLRRERHPRPEVAACPAVLDDGVEGDVYWQARESCDGASLRLLLERARAQGGSVPLELAALLGERLARACAAWREDNPAVDLHPAAVVVRFDGEPTLSATGVTGLSYWPDDAPPWHTLAHPYLPPETLAQAPASPGATLVFSLGVVLFECLTGKPPPDPWSQPPDDFEPERDRDYQSMNDDRMGWMRRELAASALPEALADVVTACLHDEPVARPTGDEVGDALARFVGGAGPAQLRELARSLAPELFEAHERRMEEIALYSD